jgi:hypothetical protein
MPWLHIADEIDAIKFLINDEATHGAFNLSSPNPISNADFSRVFGRVLKRPAWFPVPEIMMRLALVVVFDVGKIWSARVGADDWSSKAGKAVNACLVDKAPQAWKLMPGAKVAPGKYVIQLRFRPT